MSDSNQNGLGAADVSADSTPIKYEDFLEPNPFLRPWMLPYLPNNARLRDYIVMCVGIAFFIGLALLFDALKVNQMIGMPIVFLGGVYFIYDALWRTTWAGLKYGAAKKDAKR